MFPGFTSLQILQEIQNDLQKRNIELETFTDRIIFMSMFNDLDWTRKGNDEICVPHSEKVKTCAKKFSQEHWTFLGPGDGTAIQGNRSLSLYKCQCVESWNSENAERERIHTLQCGCFKHRTLVPNHSFCESAQFLRSSFDLVWAIRFDSGRKGTRKYLRKRRIREHKNNKEREFTRSELTLLVSSPRLASGNRLRENIQDFESLSETIQIHKGLRTRSILGIGCEIQDQTWRERRFWRSHPMMPWMLTSWAKPQSRVYAVILGETNIGPVIEVHVVQIFGTHGLEIEIPSPKIQNGHSWVLISRGKNRFVDELQIPDIRHSLTCKDNLKESVFAMCTMQ